MSVADAGQEVSVVMATWNRPQFLSAAIDAVLAQTTAIRELIIADDGSDRPARQLLEHYAAQPRIRVLWRSHCGRPGMVRNGAIQAASGRYVAFVDSDDVWHPEKLQRQLAALRANPQCRWSYTSWHCIDPNEQPLPLSSDPRHRLHRGPLLESLAQFRTDVPLPSVLAERTLLFEAGLFDDSMGCYEDYDLWMRMAVIADAVGIPEPLVGLRRHSEHYSRSDGIKTLKGRHRYLERALAQVRSRAVRAELGRMLAIDSARLASLAALAGDAAQVGDRLRGSLTCGWSMPRWWANAAVAHCRLNAWRARRMWARLR
jgi:glycosyltransferase involved in cell wall biosynthesis